MPAHIATTRLGREVTSLTIVWWHPSELTPAEHNARAMVMGRYYNAVMHDYRLTSHAISGNGADPIDAETLEPVTWSTDKRARSKRETFRKNNNLSEEHMVVVVRACYLGGIDYATVL